MVNTTYVMSDLHGQFTQFIRMLRYIEFKATDRLLILGNVINGGPQPIELLLFISQQENMKMCLGNQEIIMIQALIENDLKVFDEWMKIPGGRVTYDCFKQLDNDKQYSLLNYLKESCGAFFTTDEFFLSSSGPRLWEDNQETNTKTKKPTLKDLMDKIEETGSFESDINFYQKAGLEDKIVIFGDIPVQVIRQSTKDYKIWHDQIYHDKICINSGVDIKPHKLACLRLNDMKEFYF